MPSNKDLRDAEPVVGYVVGVLILIGFVTGFVLQNWGMWIPLAVTITVIYLLYRLVLAVEDIADNS